MQQNQIILEYGWMVALIPLLTHYTEDHHLVYLSLLYAGVLLNVKRTPPEWIWGIIGLSWLLINAAFYFKDLSLFPSSIFLFRYINTYGALLVCITGYILLHSKIPNKEIANG